MNQGADISRQTIYVGTYTRQQPAAAGATRAGLYLLGFDPTTGVLEMSGHIAGPENQAFLSVAPDGRTLHTVWEVPDWPEGVISSYGIAPATGALTYLGLQGSKGVGPCYITADSRGRFGFAANYGSGHVAMFPRRPDGSLGEGTSALKQRGHGPDPKRQRGPHPHCMVVSPDDGFAFSADLGADRVFGYEIDYENGQLVPVGGLDLPPGSGPRHISFHPDRAAAYVSLELTSRVAVLGYSARHGRLELLEQHSTLPDAFGGHNLGADVHVHPSGRWVYVSNRGDDSIAVFEVIGDGRLALVGHRPSEGETPRSFVITTDGAYLLIANQGGNNVVVMRVDTETGMPGETVSVVEIATPVCLAFGPRPTAEPAG
jgi:6-phosphogluconolactonase